jgi:hypothetical protein
MKKRLTLHDKAELAMASAIRKVVAEHKRDGRPLAVWDWEKSKVAWVMPGKVSRKKSAKK